MSSLKKNAIDIIDAKKDVITNLNDKIWSFAELSLLEYKSTELYCEMLEKEGFKVEKNVAGIKTAFSGSFGSGKPHIGILAEYDALDALSQAGGETSKYPIVEGGAGHGCGHSALGAGSFAAALAVKNYLETSGKSGTVTFYGCPGEEGVAGKAFMARDGIFNDVDSALTWHPSSINEVTSGTHSSCIQIEYHFSGISAHAAGDPHLGRSALDAVELMNIGVQFLREHMTDESRIHYAITDAGGYSPNVVQPKAKVLYMIRATKVSEALALKDRVDDIANGAALMTGTKVSQLFVDGMSNVVPNYSLEKVLYKNFEEIGVSSYTNEELSYAQRIVESYENPNRNTPGLGASESVEKKAWVEDKMAEINSPINEFLMPLHHSQKVQMGSTDVGDVSWVTPTAQITVATWPKYMPGHSWQIVSCGNTGLVHKGVLLAGKVIAGAAIDLIDNPELIIGAKKEFEVATKEGYNCPIPKDAVATPVEATL